MGGLAAKCGVDPGIRKRSGFVHAGERGRVPGYGGVYIIEESLAHRVDFRCTALFSRTAIVTDTPLDFAPVSRFFLGNFLVSSVPVCDGGIQEFLLVFLIVFSSKIAIKSSNKRHNRPKNYIGLYRTLILPTINENSPGRLWPLVRRGPPEVDAIRTPSVPVRNSRA